MPSNRAAPLVVGLVGVCLACLPAADSPGKTGGVRGAVRFTGEPPAPVETLTTEGLKITHYDLLVDAKTKGLRFVVAVLEDAPPQPKTEVRPPVVMDQKDMVFVPRVLAVQHGQSVRFDNSDSVNHSVLSALTRPGNAFHVFINGGQPHFHQFEAQKHPIALGCALHAWMKAWVYVLPHPWFAVTDEKGTFKIENIPSGTYSLWLRHADSGLQERWQVVVEAGKAAEVLVEWKNWTASSSGGGDALAGPRPRHQVEARLGQREVGGAELCAAPAGTGASAEHLHGGVADHVKVSRWLGISFGAFMRFHIISSWPSPPGCAPVPGNLPDCVTGRTPWIS